MTELFYQPGYNPKGPFRLFIDDLDRDTVNWSDDLKYKYVRLLSHLWSQGGWVPDDDEYIATVIGLYRGRGWHETVGQLRSKLIEKAFLTDKKGERVGVSNGLGTDKETVFLAQPRVLRDLAKAYKISQIKAAAGRQGGRPEKAYDKPYEKPPLSTSHSLHNNEESAGALSPLSENIDECESAFQAWNILADKLGLPRAIKLSDGRRRQIKQRLKDAGGLEGWKSAIYNIGKSTFLMGRNDRGWKANLDFVLRESRFIKLIEGGYTDSPMLSTDLPPGTKPEIAARYDPKIHYIDGNFIRNKETGIALSETP